MKKVSNWMLPALTVICLVTMYEADGLTEDNLQTMLIIAALGAIGSLYKSGARLSYTWVNQVAFKLGHSMKPLFAQKSGYTIVRARNKRNK